MTASMTTCLFRTSLILILMASVVTVLYFTPMPEQYFKSCDRPCHSLDWPMICRFKLTLEVSQTLGSECAGCSQNTTKCKKGCIIGDGSPRSLLSVNKQLPGPTLHVCEGDIMVVDVVNNIPDRAVAMHWRGQHQRETPFMDGTPLVTQCPVASHSSFQYKFRASGAGTHLYHSYSGVAEADGIFGAIVVRQPESEDPNQNLFDVDDKKHVILISQWTQQMALQNAINVDLKFDSFLINGRGDASYPESNFKVTRGLRHRMRLAYTGGVEQCGVHFTVETHTLKVIMIDGVAIVPFDVENIVLNRGERIDFILHANQKLDSYKVKVASAPNCKSKKTTSGVLSYVEASERDVKDLNHVDANMNDLSFDDGIEKTFSTSETSCNREDVICLSHVKTVNDISEDLKGEKVDQRFYLPIGSTTITGPDGLATTTRHHIGNITFSFPSSPLLTQPSDVTAESVCSSKQLLPKGCKLTDSTCECVHVEEVELGDLVEVVLIDTDGETDHVFHLHGYHFSIVGVKHFPETPTLEQVEAMDAEGTLFKRNFANPVSKDTVTLPRGSVVAIRFVAQNPGYWILREEHYGTWTRGLDVVFKVGSNEEHVEPPSDFPKCGSYVGPKFFLI